MFDNRYKVHRMIRVFANSSDAVVGEIDLSFFDLAAFQEVFCIGRDDPMFDSYPIEQDKVAFLTHYLAADPVWNFQDFSYFLEADAG